MSLTSKLNLISRLTIYAFTDKKRTKPASPSQIEVMYNPESVSFSFGNPIKPVGMEKAQDKTASNPGKGYDKFTLKLTLDAFHPTKYSRFADPVSFVHLQTARLPGDTIKKEVMKYVNFCRGKKPGPPLYLSLNWAPYGENGIIFCRLTEVGVDYSLFDRGGNPLRAALDLKFSIDQDADEQKGGLGEVETIDGGKTIDGKGVVIV